MAYFPKPGDYTFKTVTLIPGDGVGPEVTASVCSVVAALKAPIQWERFDVTGNSGETSNIPKDLKESILRNRVCLKGTLFTPLSKSNTNTQSFNVQLRKELDTAVNVVHARSLPGVSARHKDLDIVVIRENTEGEYSGLEHEIVPGVVSAIKVMSEAKCRRVLEYAFEFALLNDRKKVTVVHKANIMKLADGLWLKTGQAVAQNYPQIEFEPMIVDNTCMQMASRPEQFDVMVLPNLYGNLVTNIACGLMGGVALAPGANLGGAAAIFEQGARAVQSDVAGKGIANPTAMLNATVLMLRHLQWQSHADKLEQAIEKVYMDAQKSEMTPDVGGTGDTKSFTEAVIRRL
eukprot:TRINITY_DN775_c0_g2_i1.p1 TRINITY_DN775_c0_g2~~TRINITY_DN775_c0_g2_i1.p1  ORF type:complete len:374 (-),score=50.62 TRINITY_DN775_c0_g2_i1:145-1185(-)